MRVALFVTSPVINRFVISKTANAAKIPPDYGPWIYDKVIEISDLSDAGHVVSDQGYFMYELASDGAMRGLPSGSLNCGEAWRYPMGH